jgi:DNA repair exonuclease SbcCD ATPase subunit
MIIFRQKRPELFKVTISEQEVHVYEDKVAQQIIESHFGTAEMWQACCYIFQGTRTYLLTSSNAEKMSLLSSLSFSTEDPDMYISKIDENLSKCQKEFDIDQTLYEKERVMFERDINLAQLDWTLFLVTESRTDCLNELSLWKEQQKNLKLEFEENQRLAGLRMSLCETRNILESRLNDIPLFEENEISEIESELFVLNKKNALIPFYSQLNRLRSEEITIDSNLLSLDYLPNINIDEAQLNDATLHHKKYTEMLTLCKSLNVSYSDDAIEYEKEKIHHTLDSQPRINTLNSIFLLRDKISSFPLLFNDKIKEEKLLLQDEIASQPKIKASHQVASLKVKISEIKKIISSNALPHNEKIFLEEDNLEKINLEINNEINNHRKKLAVQPSLQNYENIQTKIKELEQLNLPVEDLKENIDQIRLYLDSQPQFQTIASLFDQIMALDVSEIPESAISELTEQLLKMKSSLNILTCPSCSTHLRLIQSNLVIAGQKPSSQQEISDVSSRIDKLALDKKKFEQKETLQKQLTSLLETFGLVDQPLESIRPLPPDQKVQYETYLSQLQEMHASKEKLKQLQIQCESLRKLILNSLSENSDLTPLSPLEIKDIEMKISSYEMTLKDLKKISEHQQEIDTLTKSFSLDDKCVGKILSPNDINNIKKKISSLDADLEKINEKTKLVSQLEALQSSIGVDNNSSLERDSPLTFPQINQLKERLNKLSKITILTPLSEDITTLTKIVFRKKQEKRKNEIRNELERLEATFIKEALKPEEIPLLPQRISDLKTRLDQLLSFKSNRTTFTQQLEDTKSKIDLIVVDDSIRNTLEKKTQEILHREKQLEMSKLIDKFIILQKDLEVKRERVQNQYKELLTLQKMKAVAIEVECHTLQNTVDSINMALGDIVTILFDDPISVTLQLFKTLKTKDRVKPTVNVSISYRGGEYDSISQLSGGEGDRLSLAFTLALSRLNTCPILLLDESMASLDANLKESCLKVLRTCSESHKTIICINHEGTEGHYDDIIPIV